MTIIRINQFEAKKGFEEELFKFLQSITSIVQDAPGCKTCRLLRSTENAEQFAIIEEWESIEAHQSAAKAIPMDKMKQVMTLLVKPPSGSYYKT